MDRFACLFLLVALLLSLPAATAVAQAPPTGDPGEGAARPDPRGEEDAGPPTSLASPGEPVSDEAEVREVLETFRQGIRRKDAKFAMSRIAPNCDTAGRSLDPAQIAGFFENNEKPDLVYQIKSVKEGPGDTLVAVVAFSLTSDFDPINAEARFTLNDDGNVVKVEPVGDISAWLGGPPATAPAPARSTAPAPAPARPAAAAPAPARPTTPALVLATLDPAEENEVAQPTPASTSNYTPPTPSASRGIDIDRMTPDKEEVLGTILPDDLGNLDDTPDPRNQGIDYGNFN